MMKTFRLTIAYDGTRYAGWARQPGLRTVQGVLEAAVGRILGGQEVALTVAGRTDAGVHASGQVASFELDREPPDRFAERINAVLPRDLSVSACEPVPGGFDARRWARSRSYRYRVLTAPARDPFEEGRALWWPYPLDRVALDECGDAILGAHDFTAFTPTQTEHVRFERVVSRSTWFDESADLLTYEITADAFMRNMIRVLVGTMLEVATGRREAAEFRALLGGAPRERAGETAPAHGLYLTGVEFGDGPAFTYPNPAE
ncbi:MAG: tRNA pseudouridine(38-40) synthase TruA [Actinomycetota bacterium]|nr:tRNA pseudouridine(38-40) synthase TruA [Actinomycetota bacterium]